MKLLKNKKGSELTEKIMVTAFSVAMAAAVILWMFNVIKISKSVNLNGGGNGGGDATLTIGAQKKKAVVTMSSDQEYNLFLALKADQTAHGDTTQDASERMMKEFNRNSPGHLPQAFETERERMYCGNATFTTLPSNDSIKTATGASNVTFVAAGYVDLTCAQMFQMPISSAFMFVLCSINESNVTPECKAAANNPDINEDTPESRAFFKQYVFGGATSMCPLSGSGNYYLNANIPGLVQDRVQDAVSQTESVGFGEAGFAYVCYNVDGAEMLYAFNQDDGKLYDVMGSAGCLGDAVLGSISAPSSPYFTYQLLNMD